MPSTKKIVIGVLVIFFLYAVLTSPTDAANIVTSAWSVIANALGNIGVFFDSLLS